MVASVRLTARATASAVLPLALFAAVGCADTAPPDTSGLDAGPPRDGAVRDAGNPIDLSCLNMIPLRLWTTDPSAVAMLYRIETCTGETVVFVPGAGETVFDYYALEENGSSLSSEAVPDVDLSGNQRAYVTLLLDFSSSTRAVEAELLAAARAFVDALLGASSRVWVGIQIFDGRPDPVTILRPTPDVAELRSAITALADYADPLADEGSTNLNGAIAASVPALQAWQDAVMARNDMGLVTSGYLVAFTDGRDTSDRVTTAAAASAVSAARAATGAGGASANVQTYAVALASADFTAAARTDLLTIVGGDERSLYEGSLTELSAEFTDLARRIAEQAEATHLLKYCSAARSGARSVELGILPSRGVATNAISFDFSADGFAPGCAAFIETICVDRDCGGFNCGGCDDRSESCIAATGQCESACLAGGTCSGETITTDLGYELLCTPDRCAPPDAGVPDGGAPDADVPDAGPVDAPPGSCDPCPPVPDGCISIGSACPCSARLMCGTCGAHFRTPCEPGSDAGSAGWCGGSGCPGNACLAIAAGVNQCTMRCTVHADCGVSGTGWLCGVAFGEFGWCVPCPGGDCG